MKRCRTCKNALFDEHWGEIKCKVKKRRIPDPEREAPKCKSYEKTNELAVAAKREADVEEI